MQKARIPTWVMLTLAAVGLLLAIPVLWVLVSLTAKPLYEKPESMPSVRLSEPSAKWAGVAERARQIVRETAAGKSLPGVSVAVGLDGDVVWAEGFGFADLRTGVPVTPDHRFRIGTASTALTSAAAGMLLADGRLKLDQDIQTYVPAFPRKQWPVTMRELMEDRAGVIADGGNGVQLFTKHCERPAEALQYFADDPLLFQPGTQYRYSSYGWILVSAAIEAATGEPFLTYMRTKVFEPLGMRDTIVDTSTAKDDDDPPIANLVRELIFDPRTKRDTSSAPTKQQDQARVTSYYPRFASDPEYGLHLMRPLDYSCYAGAGAFMSTPSDLVRFGMATRPGRYLKTVTLAGKQTRVTGQNGDSLGGMVASLMVVPESGLVIAVTSNISYADTYSLALKIAELFTQQRK